MHNLGGSIVRGVVLVVLAAVVVPAVVTNGDVLAVPVVAIAVLAALAVAMLGLAHWLLTVGAPAPWVARRLRLPPDRLVLVAAAVVGVVSAVGLAWLRTEQHHPRSPIAQLDLRAAATATRLAGERDLMQSLNERGIRSMVLLGGLLVLAAVAVGAFRSAALLGATMAASGGLVELLKTSPPRPLPALGQLSPHVTSWPSGHAALQGSLALGIVLWWWAAGLPRPSIVAAVVGPVAVLVGYSRAFLGIHWLSEVFAGWLVATVAAAFVLAVDRLVVPRLRVPAPAKRWPVLLAGVVALAVTVVSVQSVHRFHDRGPSGFPRDFPGGFRDFDRSAVPAQPTRLAAVDPASVLDPLPRFSSTLLGRHGQPLGLVVVADGDRMRAAIRAAGWRDAGVVTPDDLAPRFWSGLTGRADRDAPVAPTFFDTRAADLVVHRAAGRGEASHEAELWELPVVTARGCSVWGVTASLHDRDEWNWHTLMPDEHIAPDVDAERDALAARLVAAGRLDDVGRFAFVGAMHGSTPGGPYVTDGRVALLRQPGCS